MSDSVFKPGPRNLITDVDGIGVGNAEDRAARTGVTVILPDRPATAAVDVRGGGPGTRETDALDPTCLVEIIHGICLSGGSVFGLEAASGVVSWLSARGRGLDLGPPAVPIVPSAILFDLANGGEKTWGDTPPYRSLALDACDSAGAEFPLGNSGAGLGATAGDLKGGLGSASAVAGRLQVGALVAANPFGSAVIPGTDTLWAWPLEQQGEFGGQQAPASRTEDLELGPPVGGLPGGNTVIGVIATNLDLTRAEARRVAMMAQDGIARAVRPSHTPFDGDTLFVLATGTQKLSPDRPLNGFERAAELTRLGSVAADCVARSIGRAMVSAESLGAFPAYRQRPR